MNVPVEIRLAEFVGGDVIEVVTYHEDCDYEVRVDAQTRDWILKVQKDFAEVQEYLRSIHPDYMEG